MGGAGDHCCDDVAAVSQANRIVKAVLRPISGVKPKKMPMATPPAIASGVSRMASSFNECSWSQRRGSNTTSSAVKCHGLLVAHAAAAENVQRRPDG